jgi:hypothetical protein
MSTPERADPFAADDLDVSGFAPAAEKPAPPARAVIRKISEENNFPSRAPAVSHAPPKAQRRRRTGRNAQVNIKATQETIDRLVAISDRQKWVFGETLQHALDALEQSLTRLQATS